jgi:Protein of unknown function (DUF3574)
MDRATSPSRVLRRFAGFALLASLSAGLLPGAASADPQSAPRAAEHVAQAERRQEARCPGNAGAFVRTELFFGLSRPGGVIAEEDFKAFVDARVTPRFPDGLTVLTGNGQFRSANGTIVVEGSKLLILLVPRRDGEADRKIEAIRRDYQHQFQQESVLRTDAATCVSF